MKSASYCVASRAFDLAVGIPAAIAAVPILAVLTIVVGITSGLPVFLLQERVGAAGRTFRVVKFRTMRRGVPVIAKSLLAPGLDTYTPIGPLLRALSLDELPQLWNVLRGDMSIVGPRPALSSQHDLLALRRQHRVHEQKPGITGLAQVLGRESLTLSTKVRCETLYRKRQSFGLDLVILLRTVSAIFSRRGAY